MSTPILPGQVTAARLDALYEQYNQRRFVHPDPLEFLYDFEDPADREIVGLVASGLAFGRVAQILVSVRLVLSRMAPTPSDYVTSGSLEQFRRDFAGFVHRYADGESVAMLLEGIRLTLRRYGSLQACVASGLASDSESVLPGMERLVASLQEFPQYVPHPLLSSPNMGSACKRLNLYFRWMVRSDQVDPGGWENVSKRLLVVPLDTHLFRVASEMRLTQRRSPDLKCALEVTRGFGRFSPEDPVKYDFALTRPGIWASFGGILGPDGEDHG